MRRRLLDIALLAVCLCLAPSPYQLSDPDAALAAATAVDLGKGPARLPDQTDVASLARDDPVALLEAGLRRYRREVHGYTCILAKHERIGRRVKDPEVVRCVFREEPFSVYMHWLEGKEQADKTLFVQGEYGGHVLIHPARPLSLAALRAVGKYYVDRAPEDPQVRGSSRYSVLEFGIARGMERTYLAWKSAKQRGTLRTVYRGLQTSPETGNRPCHVISRLCDPPEEEGLTEVTIAIDEEMWLQIGSKLEADGQLIGSYYFRDIQLNPKFPANQFSPEVLK